MLFAVVENMEILLSEAEDDFALGIAGGDGRGDFSDANAKRFLGGGEVDAGRRSFFGLDAGRKVDGAWRSLGESGGREKERDEESGGDNASESEGRGGCAEPGVRHGSHGYIRFGREQACCKAAKDTCGIARRL